MASGLPVAFPLPQDARVNSDTHAPLWEAVLFDLDGTLADSVEDVAASANHVRCAFDLDPLPLETLRGYVGDGIRVLMQRTLERDDPADLDRAIGIWKPHYEVHGLDHTRPYPGIEELLRLAVARGLRLGVVSNKLESLSVVMLEGLGWGPMFPVVVGGDSTRKRKPDPEPLLLAMERLGVSPGRTLMVGDSPNDIRAARAAGCASCGVLWGIGAEAAVRAAQPDHLARVPAEVAALLGGG